MLGLGDFIFSTHHSKQSELPTPLFKEAGDWIPQKMPNVRHWQRPASASNRQSELGTFYRDVDSAVFSDSPTFSDN